MNVENISDNIFRIFRRGEKESNKKTYIKYKYIHLFAKYLQNYYTFVAGNHERIFCFTLYVIRNRNYYNITNTIPDCQLLVGLPILN